MAPDPWSVHEWVTTAQAATYLQVHRSTVQRWLRLGLIPSTRVGGILRIRRQDVEAFLASGFGGDPPSEDDE